MMGMDIIGWFLILVLIALILRALLRLVFGNDPLDTKESRNAAGGSEKPQYDSPYLPSEMQKQLLVADENGLPPLYFIRSKGAMWLCEESTGLLVNVSSRYLQRLGIYACRIRGTNYYKANPVFGPAQLVREPHNQYDPNAVAIYSNGRKVGYFNKGKARSLARVIDAGEELDAYIISVHPPKVIATSPEILKHLW